MRDGAGTAAGMGAGALAAAAAPETAFTSLVTIPAVSGVASVTAEQALPRQMKAGMQLHPGFAGAGELATGVVPGVYGAPNAVKAAHLVLKNRGALAAGAYLAAPMISGMTGALAAQAAQALLNHQPVKLNPTDLAFAALLAAACHGISLQFRDYSAEQLLDIYKRGSSAPNNRPQDVLNKLEFELYQAIEQRLRIIQRADPNFDPANLDLTAQQAYVRQKPAKGPEGANSSSAGNTGETSGGADANRPKEQIPIGAYNFEAGTSAGDALPKPSEALARLRASGNRIWDHLTRELQEKVIDEMRKKRGFVRPYEDQFGNRVPVAPGVEHDPRKWLAEKLTHENVRWADSRRAANVSEPNLISQLAALQRAAMLEARRAKTGENVGDATRAMRAEFQMAYAENDDASSKHFATERGNTLDGSDSPSASFSNPDEKTKSPNSKNQEETVVGTGGRSNGGGPPIQKSQGSGDSDGPESEISRLARALARVDGHNDLTSEHIAEARKMFQLENGKSALSAAQAMVNEAQKYNSPPKRLNDASYEVFGYSKPPETLPFDSPLLQITSEIKTSERDAWRNKVVRDTLATASPVPEGYKPIAILLGGGSGSGKSTICARLQEEKFVPTSNIAKINPDDFKTKAPEWTAFEAANDGRAADLLHGESAQLSGRTLNEAIASRKNFIYDTTLSNYEKNLALIKRLQQHGYEVRMVGVSTDVDTAISRTFSRAAEENRYVPPLVTMLTHMRFNRAAEQIARACDSAVIFENTHAKPKRILKTINGNLDIVDENLYHILHERGSF